MRFVAGQGAGAQSHREDVAGRGAARFVAGRALWRSFCWLGAPWRSSIGKLLLARSTVVESHREAVAGESAAAKVLNGRGHCGRYLSGCSCWPGAAKWRALKKSLSTA